MRRTKWIAAVCVAGVAAVGSAQNGMMSTAFKDSISAESGQDYATAIKLIENLSTETASSYYAQLRLGWLYYCSKERTQSIAHYNRAIQISPTAIEPMLGLMLPQMADGRNDDAIRTAQMILRQDPNNYTALSRLAWLQYLKRDYRIAAGNYRRLTTLYPTDTEMLLGLGYALAMAGDTKESERCFRTVLLLSPENSRALDGLELLRTKAKGGAVDQPPGGFNDAPPPPPMRGGNNGGNGGAKGGGNGGRPMGGGGRGGR